MHFFSILYKEDLVLFAFKYHNSMDWVETGHAFLSVGRMEKAGLPMAKKLSRQGIVFRGFYYTVLYCIILHSPFIVSLKYRT